MVLELELIHPQPDALASRLTRASPFKRLRAAATTTSAGSPGHARARGGPESVIWLDTADGDLAAAGLALEQARRGSLRRRLLLRILPPPDEPWRLGSPPAQVVELPGDAVPEEAGGAVLIPVVAFEGRRSLLPLRLPSGAAAEAEILTGRLRAVAAERAVARLHLSAPSEAAEEVFALARALAAEFPLLPSRAALAEEGRALARGEAHPRPRRRGAPDLSRADGVDDALRMAIGHLGEAMLWNAPLARAELGPEGVHQMRVALRRLRSALKVFRPAADGPALRTLDADLKALADRLGPARDWDVFLGGLGAKLREALPDDLRIAALLKAAGARRDTAYAELRQALDGPALRRIALDLAAVAEAQPWRAEGDAEAATLRDGPLRAFAVAALERHWRRLAKAGPDISALEDAELHELRLKAKRMRYAAELFAPLWRGKATRRFLKRLGAVQEAFGVANDAAVARGLVQGLEGVATGSRGGGGASGRSWAIGVAEGFALSRVARSRGKAEEAWAQLLSTDPFWED